MTRRTSNGASRPYSQCELRQPDPRTRVMSHNKIGLLVPDVGWFSLVFGRYWPQVWTHVFLPIQTDRRRKPTMSSFEFSDTTRSQASPIFD